MMNLCRKTGPTVGLKQQNEKNGEDADERRRSTIINNFQHLTDCKFKIYRFFVWQKKRIQASRMVIENGLSNRREDPKKFNSKPGQKHRFRERKDKRLLIQDRF